MLDFVLLIFKSLAKLYDMTAPDSSTKESRHLWVGGLPDTIDEAKIKDYFSK